MLPFHVPLPGQPGGPPDLRPSYTVHITATKPQQIGTASTGGPTWFTSNGFRLQDLLSALYGMPAERIDFDEPELADRRLDVVLRLPAKESESSMHHRIVHALESQFGISIRPVARTQDVYAITIVDPKKLPLRGKPSRGGFSSTVTEFSLDPDERNTKDQRVLARLMQQKLEDTRKQSGIGLDSIDMDGDVEDLCRILETGVQRPVLDRTGYQGDLKLTIKRGGLSRDQFFHKIEADYGLAIRPAQAEVEHIIVTRDQVPAR